MFGTGHTRTHPCFSSVATAGNLPKPVTCAKARVLRPGASGAATIRNGTSALRFLSRVAVCAMFAQGAIRAIYRQPLARSGRTRIHDPSHDKTTIGTGPSAHGPSRLSLYRSWHTLCFFHSSEPVLRRPRNAEGAWQRHTARYALARIMSVRRHYAMDSLCFHIVLGLGLLLIGVAVADGIRILLEPHIRTFLQIYKLEKRRASRPILLAEWNLPKA
jgi:hypothetical protein